MISQLSKRDYLLAVLGLAVYGALVVAILPPSDYLRMLGGAAIIGVALVIIARAMRNAPPPSSSVLIVSFVGVAALVMPGFGAMGGRNGPALPIGFVGSQAIALLWATLIWRSSSRVRSPITLRDALQFSVLGAVVLSVIASIPIVLMLLTDAGGARAFLLIYPAYLLGAVTAAIIYWMLRRMAHRPFGQFIIGGLAGTCMYSAVAPIVYLSKGEAIDFGGLLGLGLVCGFLVGPPVALSLNDDAAARKR